MKTQNYLTADQVSHIRDKINQFYPDLKVELSMRNNILKCIILSYKDDLIQPIRDFYSVVPETYSKVNGLDEMLSTIYEEMESKCTYRLNFKIDDYYGISTNGEMLKDVWNTLTYRNNIKQQNSLPFYYVDFQIGKNKKQQFKVLNE
ncbi:MAG: hypothetical protein RSC93_00490 [Erysipelotrichaceae bacterium]